MKNLILKLGKWFGYSLDLIKKSFERFPITLVMTMILVVLFITSVHARYPDNYQNYLMVFALAMPFSAVLKLIHERTGKLKIGIQMVVTLLLMLSYYLVIPESKSDVFWGQYSVLLILFYALFFIVPYFPKREGFSLSLVERAGKFFLTALYALVIYLGLNAVVFSIESLFELNFPSELPADIFFCVFGLFAVPYFLGSLPTIYHQEQPEAFSKIFRTLFLYILIPIQSVYTLILYAYFIRILVLQTLPEGLIGNLVLWYALLSFLILFSVKDLRHQLPWLERYIKFFSLAMTVPVGMLVIAMGIRIHYYGLTMDRYLSVIAILFLVIGYVLLPVKKRDTSVVLYITAICFITVSFFGVLSWDKVVLREQTGRLENLLIEAGYSLNENDWMAPPVVSDKQQQVISNSLYYLTNRYEIEEIAVLPEGFTMKNADQYLGFELNNQYIRYNAMDYFNKNFMNINEPVDVGGSDYVILISRYDAIKYSLYDGHVIFEKLDASGKTSQTETKDKMSVTVDGFLVGEIDIDELARKAYEDSEGHQKIELKVPDGGVVSFEFDFIEISGQKMKTGEFNNIDYYQCWFKVSKK